jgi:DNA/RNA endonuclease YhcR with UshA esterase domain
MPSLSNVSLRSLTRRTLLAASIAVASLVLAPLASQAATITIDAARHLPIGSTVTVEGSATVASGTFASSFFDEGFAIQDRTGGIYVSLGTDLGIDLRNQVRVTGKLTDSNGLLVIIPVHDSDVSVIGRGRRVLAEFSHTGSIGEATEGRIVLVVGRITQLSDDAPFGFKIFINDGTGEIPVFINTATNINVSGLKVGQVLFVTGFSSEFEHPEIDPRFPSDIVRF